MSVTSDLHPSFLSRLLAFLSSLLAAFAREKVPGLRIYSHSTIIYWWPVWLYSAFCWAITAAHHIQINPNGQKAVNVFPGPWLGISFLGVLFFVITFSNMRTRGFHALLFLMAVALMLVGIHYTVGLPRVLDVFHLLVLYMNEGFYGAMAVFMFILWSSVVFGFDHMTSYRFTSGQLTIEHFLAHETDVALNAREMTVRLQASDLFRHKVLGLGFFGLGTGDLICQPNIPGQDPLVLENVVGVSSKFDPIQRMVNTTKTASH